jgi:hypothetical protein
VQGYWCLSETHLCIFYEQFGAYLVESSLGRRWSLAGSSFSTALLCAAFVGAKSPLAVRMSTVGVSLSATVSIQAALFHTFLVDRVVVFRQCGLCCMGKLELVH